jgi:hypothetical protein
MADDGASSPVDSRQVFGAEYPITITSTGLIAVDSDEMYAAASRMIDAQWRLAAAAHAVEQARAALAHAPKVRAHVPGLGRTVGRIRELQSGLVDDAGKTRLMAGAFEYADLQARQQVLTVNFPDEAAALQLRLDALALADPGVKDKVAWLQAEWAKGGYQGTSQTWQTALLGEGVWAELGRAAGRAAPGLDLALNVALQILLASLIQLARGLRKGVLVPGEQFAPKAEVPEIELKVVSTSRPAGPPASAEEALRRIPQDTAAQIRIDRMTLPDGTRRFAVYLDGTQDPLGDDPWNMVSNVEMYLFRKQAASYVATTQALEAAGAQPGDVLDVVTYSQGGLIGSALAMGGQYAVRTLYAAGNPVAPVVPETTQVGQLRHRDDPVGNGLTASAYGGTSGADNGFVVTRDALGDEDHPGDLDEYRIIAPHLFDEYLETARMSDDAHDPRVEAMVATWQKDAAGAEIDSFVYQATTK